MCDGTVGQTVGIPGQRQPWPGKPHCSWLLELLNKGDHGGPFSNLPFRILTYNLLLFPYPAFPRRPLLPPLGTLPSLGTPPSLGNLPPRHPPSLGTSFLASSGQLHPGLPSATRLSLGTKPTVAPYPRLSLLRRLSTPPAPWAGFPWRLWPIPFSAMPASRPSLFSATSQPLWLPFLAQKF